MILEDSHAIYIDKYGSTSSESTPIRAAFSVRHFALAL